MHEYEVSAKAEVRHEGEIKRLPRDTLDKYRRMGGWLLERVIVGFIGLLVSFFKGVAVFNLLSQVDFAAETVQMKTLLVLSIVFYVLALIASIFHYVFIFKRTFKLCMYSYIATTVISFAVLIFGMIVKTDNIVAQIIGTIIGTWIAFAYFYNSTRVGVYFASEEKYQEWCAAAPYLVYPSGE